MGSVLCGANDAKKNALDEAYGRRQGGGKGEGPLNDKDFVLLLCKRIAETDGDYKDEFEESEPDATADALGVTPFKRWATKTARCNPLWRVAETEVDRPMTVKDFQIALSSDPEFRFTGYILMAKKLSEGSGELLQPHAKSLKHWFGWEEAKTKEYFQAVVKAAGKADDAETIEWADIRAYCDGDDILRRHIEYCFGYTEWSDAQKSLVTPTKEPYVIVPLKEAQKAFDGKGERQFLGALLRMYQRAIAPPGKYKDEVDSGDRYYFDKKASEEPNGGDGDGDGDGKGNTSANDGGSRENSAYPALGQDGDAKDQPAAQATAESTDGHLDVPAVSSSQNPAPQSSDNVQQQDPAAEPSKSNSFFPQLPPKQ